MIVPIETFIKHHAKILELRHTLNRSAIYTYGKRIYIDKRGDVPNTIASVL